MRKPSIFIAALVFFLTISAGWAEVAWEASLASAQKRAQAESKPILILQIFGKLNEKFP